MFNCKMCSLGVGYGYSDWWRDKHIRKKKLLAQSRAADVTALRCHPVNAPGNRTTYTKI